MSKDLINVKWISLFAGFAVILLFSWSFLQSKSPLDLLFFTAGIMVVIIGFYIQGERVNQTVTYFMAMFSINIFQWLTVIYAIFVSQITLTTDAIIVLAIAPVMTIVLISQIRRSDLKYLGNRQKTNKDVILADKIKVLLNNKAKLVCISAGFLVMVVCLVSVLFSRSPLELYGIFVGLMVIVYGYYRESKDDNENKPSYSQGMSRNRTYREIKNVSVTINYFFAMFSIILSQWLIMYYIIFIYPAYVSYGAYRAEWQGLPYSIFISFWATFYFYIQIRESHLIKINWQGIFIGDKKIF